MDTQSLRSQLPVLVAGHMPSKARSIKYRVFDGTPQLSTLGFHVDPKPFEGRIIAITDEAVVIKTGRVTFAVLNRSLVPDVPAEGDRVRVEPYARRRFDGLRADTPEVVTDYTAEGKPYTVTRHILGSAPAQLPIPEPNCRELQDLIHQLEQLPAPDGFRRIAHMLVDANATDFTWVDPRPENIIDAPPAISFSVSTDRFQGRITILYRRGLDLYAVEARSGEELIKRIGEVYFDELGETLAALFDDGSWKRIRVQTLSHPRPTRH